MVSTREKTSSKGVKRSAESGSATSPPTKKGKVTEKGQKTLEETIGVENDEGIAEQSNANHTSNKETKLENNKAQVNALDKREEALDKRQKALEEKEGNLKNSEKEQGTNDMVMSGVEDDQDIAEQISEKPADGQKNGNGLRDGEKNAFDEVKGDAEEVKEAAAEEQDSKTEAISKNNGSVTEDKEREEQMPSSILEKGIIYFFFRGRVGVENPQGIEDVARSYIVLRPLPLGAQLHDGPLPDDGNARLLALPKKILPKTKQDRFLLFVESPKAHIKDLRKQFGSSDYATQSGTSHTPSATPLAEGVYAITSTGRESHLAYHITYPEVGEVQKEFGINTKGSFVLSLKNPEAPAPANASLSNPASYPAELQDRFRKLRWLPLEPEFLNYESSQVLFIGEGAGDYGNALDEMEKDERDGKENPEEEVERLFEEDFARVKSLREDDPVFADLGMSSKAFTAVKTTW